MPAKDGGAVVVGGSAGIGAATATALCEAGWDVAAIGRSPAKLERLAGEASALPGRFEPVVSDVSDADGLTAGLAEAADRLGGVDLLVHSVATPSTHGPAAGLDAGMVYQACAAMIASVVVATGWAVRTMGDGPRGRVLLLSSGAGSRASAYRAVYSLAKAALEQFVRCACAEAEAESRRGPALTVVYPGFVDTERQHEMRALAENADTPAERAVFEQLVDRTGDRMLAPGEAGAAIAGLAERPREELACALFKSRGGEWVREPLSG